MGEEKMVMGGRGGQAALVALCRTEPEWAANRILANRARIAEFGAEMARALARERVALRMHEEAVSENAELRRFRQAVTDAADRHLRHARDASVDMQVPDGWFIHRVRLALEEMADSEGVERG